MQEIPEVVLRGPIIPSQSVEPRVFYDTWLVEMTDAPIGSEDGKPVGTKILPRRVDFFHERVDDGRSDITNMRSAGMFVAPLAAQVRAIGFHCDYPLDTGVFMNFVADRRTEESVPLWLFKQSDHVAGLWYPLRRPIPLPAGLRFHAELRFVYPGDLESHPEYGMTCLPTGTAIRVMLDTVVARQI